MKRHPNSRGAMQKAYLLQKQLIRWTLFLVAITLLIIFIFGDHGLFQLYTLKAERKKVQKQITELRKNREALLVEKNRLENDLEYIEKLARERFRMAKKGEKVFKVVPKETTD
tara:strand:+ start:219 stop:557 length:339 start_codon:yes stop_codon:yes gene_type:complete